MPIIEVKNLGKKYRLDHQTERYTALRDVLTSILKSPFIFLKCKAQQIVGLEKKEDFWALDDISFSVEKGEVLGIIGYNGAGKSTLLKILSQITPPTTGEAVLRGRVGSLLEVGTGFHPELTGRENIFFNGSILGMSRKEIIAKFDQIVEFAGVEKFLDTPVKYYSSGMHVRLGFAVAAHLEPDVLIIDEVLAVGDIAFQKKCLGRIDEITKKEGRTILLVSHNMNTIEELCSRVMLLKDGRISMIGPTKEVVDHYLRELMKQGAHELVLTEKKNNELSFMKIYITDEKGQISNEINQSADFYINLELNVIQEVNNIDISVFLKSSRSVDVVFSSLSDSSGGRLTDLKSGYYKYKIKFDGGFLMPDHYYVRISVHQPGIRNIDTREDILSFKILQVEGARALNYGIGCVSLPNRWIV